MELRPIRVVHYGLGDIGMRIARLTVEQRGLEVVGGIDRDPAKAGRDLGEVIGLDHPLGTPVSDDATEILASTTPDMVIHATTSLFHEVYPQITECVRARANVISTCEELVYPYARNAVPAAELNRLALLSGVTLLGAGVNPGFIMDLLPLLLTAPCVNIRRISVTREIDATQRRAALQQRIGAGLTLDQFRDHFARGAVRHVGLHESISMLADGLGWRLDRISETFDPILAEDWLRTPYLTVAPGQVAGLRQTAHGWLHGRDVLTLTWQTAIGERDTHDAIFVDATPPVDLLIRGGLHGDQAAAALILHAIPRVLAAPPGLTTVLALPPIHYQPRPEPEELARVRYG
ncbi:MAG TPA: dihydrodipicolinate reductase [Roseiflexaceae bacterium]|jgi:4-hydroxy-tetrahydrodipicolinate reductase